MPYEYNPEDEENQNQGGNPPPPPPPQQANQPASTAASGQSPFVNLQKYLQANEDQTAGLADKVAAPIESTAQSAQDKANTAKGSFQQQVQQSTASMPTFLDQLGSGANYSPASYSQGFGMTPPDAAGLTQAQKDEIKNKRTASYSGPNSITDTNLLDESYADAGKAKTQADLSKTDQGRYSLLKQLVGNPSYKAGQTNLDQALLSGSQGAQARLGQAQQKVADADTAIAARATEANALVDPAKQQTDATRNAVNQKLNDSVASYMSRLNSDATAKSMADYQKNQSLAKTIKSGAISANDAAQLGLSGDVFGNTYGVDPSQYFKNSDSNFDINDVANPYQRSQLAALQDLQGREQAYVGEATPNAKSGFDSAGYKSAVSGAQQRKSQEEVSGLNALLNDVRQASADKIMSADEARAYGRSKGWNIDQMSNTRVENPVLNLGNGQYIKVNKMGTSDRKKVLDQYPKLMSQISSKYRGALKKL